MIRGGLASPEAAIHDRETTDGSVAASGAVLGVGLDQDDLERSADTPPGIGSRPTVGSRRPAVDVLCRATETWLDDEVWMRVVLSPGVAVKTCPQVSSGAPTGSSKMFSSVLSRMTRSVGSVESLTISHASPALALGCAVGAELGLPAGVAGAADVALGADDGEALGVRTPRG